MSSAWKRSALAFLLGGLIGVAATAVAARRIAMALDRDARYAGALGEAGDRARVLAALDAHDEASARDALERELLLAIAGAHAAASESASTRLLLPIFAGPTLADLSSAESYLRAHRLEPPALARIARLRTRLCAELSPDSKYRGACTAEPGTGPTP